MKQSQIQQNYAPFEDVPQLCKTLCSSKKSESVIEYIGNLKLTVYSVSPLIHLVPLSELTSLERVSQPSQEMISAYSKHRTCLSVDDLAHLTGLTIEKALELMTEASISFSRELNPIKPTCSLFDLEAFLEETRWYFGKEI